jgi:hypothetical protein
VSGLGVAIGTYGDLPIWGELAARAIASVEKQSMPVKWAHAHRDLLHEARNAAAHQLIDEGCNWLVFLDADDELEDDFCLTVALAASRVGGKKVVLQPSTLGVVHDGDAVSVDNFPFIAPPTDLLKENYLIIGCPHPASLFLEVGGFDDWPLLEDWAYWCKTYVAGAHTEQVPNAIYRVHIDKGRVGRNNAQPAMVIGETFTKIRTQYTALLRQKQRSTR